jgi:hypothetical protein
MKQQLNEIKKMQRLAGIITESEYRESLNNEEKDFFKQKSFTTDKGAGSGSQTFGTTNNGKEIKLNRVKPGMPVRVEVVSDGGAGSGSWGTYNIEGFVKSLEGDKLRIIRKDETSQKSVGINIRNIVKISDLS